MTISNLKDLIRKQAAIHITTRENYEIESCEIIVYDAILDYCIENNFHIGKFKPTALNNNQVNSSDEQWQIICELFADMLSGENKLKVNDTIIELLNYYYDMFWA